MSIFKIKQAISENIRIKRNLIKNFEIIKKIKNKILYCLNNSGKVFLCGNGGSASKFK